MKISMIAAVGEVNRVLGKNNKLLWNIPEDLKFFRDTTRGHIVIMGRKTFASLGKPLANRINIVVSKNFDFRFDGVVICHSINQAIEKAKETAKPEEEIFVIGGGQIYAAALPYADRLYLTIVKRHFEGDAFFPEYPQFTKVISSRNSHGNGYSYTFLTLEK